MSSPADDLCAPMPFLWTDPKSGKQRDLRVPTRDFNTEIELERWLQGEALRWLKVHKAEMTRGEYDAAFSNWLTQCATGHYAFGGAALYDALSSKRGWLENAWLQLGQEEVKAHNATLTREALERLYVDDDAFKELDQVLGRVNDPNRKRPRPPQQPAGGAGAAVPPSPPP